MRWLVAVASALLFTASVAGAAPVDFTASQSTRALSYRGAAATATLTLTTGAIARTAEVGLEPSTWQDGLVRGSPLRTFDRKITGAGRITGRYARPGTEVPRGVSVCPRGGVGPTRSGIIVSLPARSTTRISWKVALAAPPWIPEANYLGWTLGFPATLEGSHVVERYGTHVPFFIRGPTGVDVRLTAGAGTHAAAKGAPLPYRTAGVGHRVLLTGRTRPRIPGARIIVGYQQIAGNVRGIIGTARTDAHGRFAIRWRPRHRGTFKITSTLPYPPVGRLADHNCDIALTVN